MTPEELDYIRTEASSQQRLPDYFIPTGNTSIGDMKDTEERTAKGVLLRQVQKMTGIFGELTKTRTEPELANIMERENIVIDAGDGVYYGGEDTPLEPPVRVHIQDYQAEHKIARGKVSRLGRLVANKRKANGDTDPYVYANVFTDHKRLCRLSLKREAADMEIDELERLAESLQQELAS